MPPMLALKTLRHICLPGGEGLLGQLQEHQLSSHVPGSPQGVLVRGREAGQGHGPAVVGAHDPLRQQEVAEERSHHQVLHPATSLLADLLGVIVTVRKSLDGA